MPGGVIPSHWGEISRAREGEILGDDAVGDDLAIPVHVRQVQIEGPDALDEARLERLPGARLDYAGDGVEGEEPLVEGAVLVDAELHAVARELLVDLGGVLHEVGVGRLLVELLFLLGRQTGLLPRTGRGGCASSMDGYEPHRIVGLFREYKAK